ncbi:MAG: AAA family ATPase [Candidatus Saccharibacteria bacterium]|nr:AAA family ATPase [Candidatus Saccharibacteria bacterium]
MRQLGIDFASDRAAKARVAAVFDIKPLRALLWVIAIASSIAWLGLLVWANQPLAHLIALPITFSVMPLFWYYGELRSLEPTASLDQADDVSQILDRRMLAKIRRDTTPQQLCEVIAKQPGGYFFGSRYGIAYDMLRTGLSDKSEDMATFWQQALAYAQQAGDKQVSSYTVAAALVKQLPNADNYLASIHLDESDIVAGLKWQLHIDDVFEQIKQRKHYGGIGRDLSFGWAPLLNNIGLNLTDGIQRGGMLHRSVQSHRGIVDQMMHVLAQPGKRNATLVGEVGVGKTTLVHALAQRLLEEPESAPEVLRYNQIIALDPTHLIANAKGRGQLEELLIHIFNEAIKVKNVVLFLDNAELFLKEGTGSVDLSSLLLPVLEDGALRIVLSLDEQEWLRLSQSNPGLAQLLNRVVVKPLEEDEATQVMEDQVLLLEGQYKVVYMYPSLKEAYKLAERYVRELAMPGSAIKLLEAAAGFPEQKHFITARSLQQAAEKSFDVKVQTASTAEEKDVLLNLEEKIHKRMVNQSRAVTLVSDALRRARAGVRNQNRPIGTFLFLGPTGVGKTELSKAVADAYFGGEDRMVRIDLNQYSQSKDTSRLLAVGANDPHSLCAQIIKQPFSVVLLDEIEKAHDSVLNVLLQMLDEGVLRDEENKPVSFRDAIIVATSNAGADKIRQHIDKGEALEKFEEAFTNELIDSNIFKPEFINRFDEIVLFRPLTQEELGQIVDLQLLQLNKRLGAQKINVALTDEAKQLLLSVGYDARLGARPLRRAMQRAVENVVAQKMLKDQAAPGQTIQLDAPELQEALKER